MAAATAVTTVAPAVASAAEVKTNASDMVAKAKAALADKYADNHENGFVIPNNSKSYTGSKAYLNSKYLVVLEDTQTAPTGDAFKTFEKAAEDIADYSQTDLENYVKNYLGKSDISKFAVVKNADDLANYLEGKTKDSVKLYVIKKGDVNGKSYVESNTNDLYTFEDTVAGKVKLEKDFSNVKDYSIAGDKKANLEKVADKIEYVYANGDVEDEPNDSGRTPVKAVVTLKSGSKLEFAPGMPVYDFTKAATDTGEKPFDVSDPNVGDDILNKVKSFEAKEINSDADKPVQVVLAPSDVKTYTLFEVDSVETIELGTVYTADNGYTDKGETLVNNLKEITGKDESGTYNYQGATYVRNGAKGDVDYEIRATGDKGYELLVSVPVIDKNDNHIKKTIQFKITGLSQADLVQVKNDLQKPDEVVAGRFKRLVGEDRYKTAIEVSKKQFEDKDAQSVVVVGGNALLDGLSAAPLASAKKAPVLLASPKTGLSSDTLAEIKRATDKDGLKDKTVYIVGGENSVPKSVDKDLESLGAVVVRIAGADRYATSKAVAERLYYDGQVSPLLFVVGGNGAADAMSVSPVASRIRRVDGKDTVSPILVVKKDGISQETRNFLVDKLQPKRAYVVGGQNSVSTNAVSTLNNALPNNVKATRVSGADRYDTNLKVLKKFYNIPSGEMKYYYENNTGVTGLYVASGSDKYLVDSQVVGSYARSTYVSPHQKVALKKSTPILLVGNKLTDDQLDLFKKKGLFYDNKEVIKNKDKVTQVGGAVSSEAMKVIVDKLDLR